MENFKKGVMFAVLAFVFGAAAISLAGLDPASKADAESFVTDKPAVEKTYITSKKNTDSNNDLVKAERDNTG